MNVDELLTKAQQNQVRKTIAAFVESAIDDAIGNTARDEAEQWLKAHKEEIKALTDSEMKKHLPVLVKRVIDSVLY